MLVRPLPLLNNVCNICWGFKYLSCNPWKEETTYEKEKLLIANFVYDIHLLIIFFQPHLTLGHFDHFVRRSGFVICCVWGFLDSKKKERDAVAGRMGECPAQHFSHF